MAQYTIDTITITHSLDDDGEPCIETTVNHECSYLTAVGLIAAAGRDIERMYLTGTVDDDE